MGSQLTKPYPSDPAKRYRQHRIGNRVEGTVQTQVWTVELDGTGGSWLCSVTDALGSPLMNNVMVADLLVDPTSTAEDMQTFLEVQMGAGNVIVTGGPGDAGGGTPYVITGAGELIDQRFVINGSAAFITGGGTAQTVTDTTVGGVPTSSVPIGPDLSTNDALPINGPRAREA
jgi:hypothetical protein